MFLCPLLIAYCIILNMFIFAKQLSNNLKTYGVLKSLHSTAFSKYIAFVMMSFTSDFNILYENIHVCSFSAAFLKYNLLKATSNPELEFLMLMYPGI